MADLHARLLVRCDPAWYGLRDDPPRAFAALRAAVELHAPEQHYTVDQKGRSHPSRLYCRTCRATAPCSTIRVIAEQLGVPIDKSITEEEETA